MLIELIAADDYPADPDHSGLPLARNAIIRGREVRLHEDLRMLREAIDRYKAYSDQGMIPLKWIPSVILPTSRPWLTGAG